jgi:hypothetical protein
VSTTSRTTATDQQPEPAWLHPDDDEMPPPTLQAIYGHLDPSVTRMCEAARKRMRNAFVDGLIAVHAALAESGLFKEWCQAADINYNTAKSILQRAKHHASAPSKQAGKNASHTGLVAEKTAHPKRYTLTIHFADAEEKANTLECLRQAQVDMRAEGKRVQDDDWRVTLLFLLAVWVARDQKGAVA